MKSKHGNQHTVVSAEVITLGMCVSTLERWKESSLLNLFTSLTSSSSVQTPSFCNQSNNLHTNYN